MAPRLTNCPANFFRSANKNIIKGKVINSRTNEPVANVNVYLAYTLRGTTTDDNGEFFIKGMPNGDYDLIASHIQYTKQIEKISLTRTTNEITHEFFLEPRVFQLPDVLIEDDTDDWWDYFEIFKDELLGYTEFSDSCEILNPLVIEFADAESRTFNAYCMEPIYIINKALGYRITYELEYFETDGINTKYSGIPYFQALSAESDSIKEVWESNRKRAYIGSFRDFLSECCYQYINRDTLITNTIDYEIDERYNDNKGRNQKRLWIRVDDMCEYISDGINENCLRFSIPKSLRTIHKSKAELINRAYWFTRLEQTKDTVDVDILGRNYDRFGFHMLGGYWSSQRLGDALPFEYTLDE